MSSFGLSKAVATVNRHQTSINDMQGYEAVQPTIEVAFFVASSRTWINMIKLLKLEHRKTGLWTYYRSP